jgi:hypothetical protein
MMPTPAQPFSTQTSGTKPATPDTATSFVPSYDHSNGSSEASSAEIIKMLEQVLSELSEVKSDLAKLAESAQQNGQRSLVVGGGALPQSEEILGQPPMLPDIR